MKRPSAGRHVVIPLEPLGEEAEGSLDLFGGQVAESAHARLQAQVLPVGSTFTVEVVSPDDGEFVAVCDEITDDVSAEAEIRDRARQLERLVYDLVTAMSGIVGKRDPFTEGHEVSVAHLARGIAVEMGLPDEAVEEVSMAGLLHDIGKLSVSEEVISNPGVYSGAQYEEMKEHPSLGSEILAFIDFPWPIADIVAQHHERLDGSGYPMGLKGDDICLAARILGVADVVEAMVATRPYRETPGVDKAIEEIRTHPERYDAKVAAACLRVLDGSRFRSA